MKIMKAKLYSGDSLTIGLEYFPYVDKTTGEDKFNNIFYTTDRLLCFKPSVLSVTCGASGGAAVGTLPTVEALNKKYGKDKIETVAHSTLIGKSVSELEKLVKEMYSKGIRNILALRGDAPQGKKFTKHPEGLSNASEYVKLIRSLSDEICIGVAAYPDVHPECPDMETGVEHLKIKEDMGADYAVTQMILNVDNYIKLIDLAQKKRIKMPIVPGIMLLGNYKRYKRIVLDANESGMSRIDIPPQLRDKLAANEHNDPEFEKIFLDYTLQMCETLINNGVPGLQLFTLNTPKGAYKLLQGLSDNGKVSKIENDIEKLFTAMSTHYPETDADKTVQEYVDRFGDGSMQVLIEELENLKGTHGVIENPEDPNSIYAFVAKNIKDKVHPE
jgi:methylenetetrahydrofolate reductase (NADPH)